MSSLSLKTFVPSFLSGPCLLIGMSTLSYFGDYTIILVCSVLRSFDICGYGALFWPSQDLITIALDLAWLNIIFDMVMDSKPVKNLTLYSQVSCSNLKILVIKIQKCLTYLPGKNILNIWNMGYW